jgi:predicted alpha/beta hydrolase
MALLWYGAIPLLSNVVGYFPGALTIGADLPRGVALEWARWGRTPGYLVGGDGASRRAGFARFSGPLLSYGIANDHYAPPAAIDALLSLYTGAQQERRQLDDPIGHFGFFRDRFRDTLWREAASFVEAA